MGQTVIRCWRGTRLRSALPLLALFLAMPAQSQAPQETREPTAPAAAVRHAAAQAAASLEKRRAEVPLTRVAFTGGSESGYDPGQVELALESVKNELLAELDGDDLAALRAWVDVSYPDSDKELRVILLRGGFRLATPESTAGTFVKASGSIARLKKISSLQVRLKLIVTPGEALIELWPATLPARRRSYRADTMPDLTIGLYDYLVTKDGYWDIQGQVDLVRESGSTLDCKLYPQTDPDRRLPCDLR